MGSMGSMEGIWGEHSIGQWHQLGLGNGELGAEPKGQGEF
jgi:hypothetical protein